MIGTLGHFKWLLNFKQQCTQSVELLIWISTKAYTKVCCLFSCDGWTMFPICIIHNDVAISAVNFANINYSTKLYLY